MIRDFFELLKKQRSAVLFPPADQNSVDGINKLLAELGFSQLPKEFCSLLEDCNGLVYDGVEFFGTTYHYREQKNYYFPDLLTINKHYHKYDFFKNKVIIGRLSESIIIYDNVEETYALLDRVKLRPRFETETFEELLKSLNGFWKQPAL